MKQYIHGLPQWHKRLLKNFRQTASDLQVWRAFRARRRLTIASDGGLKDRIATFGWKIVSNKGIGIENDISLFEGSGPADGPFDISSSTRSELGGLLAPLLLCASLAAHWGLRHKCRLRWLSDSKAAISRVDFITRNSHRTPRQVPEDHDYMTAIQELSKNLGRRIKTQWIKGHQDERTPYVDLTGDAKLNVDVDELATLHQTSKRQLPTEISPHLSEQKITVVINGKRYPSQINAQIRYHINGSNLKQYLTTKQGWTEDTWYKIDLHTFGVHFRRLTMGQKVQHMQFIYDLQPVGRRKGQISKNDSDSVTQCPCCRIEIENQYHLLHCRHNPKRTTSLAAFYKEVQRAQAGSKFGRIIADAFDQWFEDPASTPSMENTRDPTLDHNTLFTSEYVSLIKAAFTHQQEIGWMNAARGFLAKAWFQVACTQLQIPGGPNEEVTHTCRQDGQQRTYRVVRALHTLVTSLWQGRNEELHKQDKDTEAIQQSSTLKLHLCIANPALCQQRTDITATTPWSISCENHPRTNEDGSSVLELLEKGKNRIRLVNIE